MADRFGGDWLIWPGRFTRTDELPGEPGATGPGAHRSRLPRPGPAVLLDFAESLSTPGSQPHADHGPRPTSSQWLDAVRRGDGDHGRPDRTADR